MCKKKIQDQEILQGSQIESGRLMTLCLTNVTISVIIMMTSHAVSITLDIKYKDKEYQASTVAWPF